MTEDTEEESLESSTSQGAETDASPTSSETEVDADTSSASTPETPAKPKAESKADLIKSLTRHNEEKDEEEDDGEDAESADDAASEDAPAGETKPEAEAPADDAESKHDTSDKRSKAKQRFEVLTNHNKELKAKLDVEAPFADYGRKVLDFCKTSGVTTQDMGVALALVATAKKDPAAAAGYLEKLGVKPREIVQTVSTVPTDLDDRILEMVTDGQLTPEGAKALLGVTRAARASAPPQPVKKDEPPQAPPISQVPFVDPQKVEYDRAVAKATVDMDLKVSEYAAKYPADWPKMAPGITKAMESYAGTHPSRWAKFFEDEVAKAIAKLPKPAKPLAKPPLRPSTQTTGNQKTAPNGRQALVSALVAGKLG